MNNKDIFINNICNIASRWDADTLDSEAAMLEVFEEVQRHAAAQPSAQADECLCDRFLHQVAYSSNGVWRCFRCKRIRR